VSTRGAATILPVKIRAEGGVNTKIININGAINEGLPQLNTLLLKKNKRADVKRIRPITISADKSDVNDSVLNIFDRIGSVSGFNLSKFKTFSLTEETNIRITYKPRKMGE